MLVAGDTDAHRLRCADRDALRAEADRICMMSMGGGEYHHGLSAFA
jgi:hypothetical protein